MKFQNFEILGSKNFQKYGCEAPAGGPGGGNAPGGVRGSAPGLKRTKKLSNSSNNFLTKVIKKTAIAITGERWGFVGCNPPTDDKIKFINS